MDWNSVNEKTIKNIFIWAGNSIVGKKFYVSDDRKILITELLKYFTGNENELFDLNKGIYMHGNYGAGKSVLMAVIRKTIAKAFWKSPNGFMLTSLEGIIDTYKSEGDLDYYGYRREDKPLPLCINEFGKEMNDRIYGTDANHIIHSLLMMRYELYQDKKIITHATSNYSLKQLDVEPIISDRLVEMFNFVELKGESFRK